MKTEGRREMRGERGQREMRGRDDTKEGEKARQWQ